MSTGLLDKCVFIVADDYQLMKKLGNGSFGDVYLGLNRKNGSKVAIKLEYKNMRHPQLVKEYQILNIFSTNKKQEVIQQDNYFPNVYYYGEEGDFNVMVMQLLGPSLEDLFEYCHYTFSLKTVLMLFIQCLTALQKFHEAGFIHRDIKPDNIVMGTGLDGGKCYFIDFGLSKRYMMDNKHISFTCDGSLTGTARYASLNNHLGYEQSRRDDLESLGYTMIYLLRSKLPWQGLVCNKDENRYDKIYTVKLNTSLNDLCYGIPDEFASYIAYCRNLKFDETPHYDFWIRLFTNLFKSHQYKFDNCYDWMIRRFAQKSFK